MFLLARAFSLQQGWYTGEKDPRLEESIKQVVESWGGDFQLHYSPSYSKIINTFPGVKVHLTMYGEPHHKAAPRVRKEIEELGSALFIVGGQKVPAPVYQAADYNVAVSHQPHSEISALAIFLHELLGNDPLYQEHSNAKIKLVGGEKGWGKKQFQEP